MTEQKGWRHFINLIEFRALNERWIESLLCFSLRAKYGQHTFMNALHGSSSSEIAERLVDLKQNYVKITAKDRRNIPNGH